MQRRELLRLSLTLLGGAASASVSRALLAGDPGPGASTPLPADVMRSIAAASDQVIPRTDTPGAVDANVPQFIERIVVDWYDDAERRIFLDGIKELDRFCRERRAVGFVDAGAALQTEALATAEAEASAYEGPPSAGHPMASVYDAHTPFFTKLKELVVLGYYTSEVGARQELAYLPMPMQYDGDFDFAEVGRHWSY